MAGPLTSPSQRADRKILQTHSPAREVYFHILKKQEVNVVEASRNPNLPRIRNPHIYTYYRTECTKNSRLNPERSICSSMSEHVKQMMRDCLAAVSQDPSVGGMIFQARFGRLHFVLSRRCKKVQRVDDLQKEHVHKEFLFGIPFDPQYFVQANCIDDGIQQVRYKMRFTQYDKEEEVAKAESHIEEQEDGTFKLVWTRKTSKDYRTQSKVKLDVVRPGSRVDIRIVNLLHLPCCSEDEAVYKIAENIAKSTTKTPAGELSMQLAGDDFCVDFVRKKCMTTYKWKDNPELSIVNCEGTNCENLSNKDSLHMRENRQYDPITVRFKDEPLKEIYFNGTTHFTRTTEESDHDVMSTVDQFLSGFERFVGASFCVAELLEDTIDSNN